MNKRTPGPWYLREYTNSTGVFRMSDTCHEEEIARLCSWECSIHARRIVACVNACAKIPTEELERQDLVAAIDKNLDERADLLEACKSALAFATTLAEDDEYPCTQRDAAPLRDEIAAILAKAERRPS